MRALLSLVLVTLASACGASAGSPCSTPNATTCAGASTLLVCEGSTWGSYPCPACAGDRCDWKGALAGDACPRVAETFGTCPFDGRAVSCFWSVTADAGVFVEAACGACQAGKSLDELGRCGGGRCTCN